VRRKNGIITQHTFEDSVLCPAKIYNFFCRTTTYASSSKDTTVNTFLPSNNKSHHLTGVELLMRLCLATISIGPDILGFIAQQIGLHSARSGVAIVMYLVGVPNYYALGKVDK
jgi:hypothetical protein